MKCNEIEFGRHQCAYSIALPYSVEGLLAKTKYINIDKCLLPEIVSLWEQGIKTTGCCCGHGDKSLASISVKPEFIPKMKELGYEVFYNSCRPDGEDMFIPKTEIVYGDAKVRVE